jgi:hypothetical protein
MGVLERRVESRAESERLKEVMWGWISRRHAKTQRRKEMHGGVDLAR